MTHVPASCFMLLQQMQESNPFLRGNDGKKMLSKLSLLRKTFVYLALLFITVDAVLPVQLHHTCLQRGVGCSIGCCTAVVAAVAHG